MRVYTSGIRSAPSPPMKTNAPPIANSTKLTASTTRDTSSLLARFRVTQRVLLHELQPGKHADEVDQRIREREIEEIRPAVQQRDHRKQQHGLRAEHVHGEHAVVYDRPEQRAGEGERHRDENRDRGGVVHRTNLP